MDEKDFKMKARLRAIEFLIANLYAMLYTMTGTPQETVRKVHADTAEYLKSFVVLGVDPAMSDALSSEIEENVLRLLKDAENLWGEWRRDT